MIIKYLTYCRNCILLKISKYKNKYSIGAVVVMYFFDFNPFAELELHATNLE